jgi:transcriptional regulator with XRE-family HTH domain
MIKLSEYVRDIVSKKGLSSSEVQKRSRNKISFGYVNDIINERTTNPSVEKLQALAQGLGVPEEDIFRVARGLPIEDVEDPTETALVTKFHRLSEGRQQEILKLLDFYELLELNGEVRVMTPDEWVAEKEKTGPDVIEVSDGGYASEPEEG